MQKTVKNLSNPIKIKSNVKKKLNLKIPRELKESNITAQLKRISESEYELNLKIKAPARPGRLNKVITLDTNVKEQPELKIRYNAFIISRINVNPQVLYMNQNSGNISKGFIRINNMGTTPVNILSAEADAPDIKVDLRTAQEGKYYNIVVTIPADHKYPRQGNKITARTDDAESPVLTIPIRPRQIRPRRPQRMSPPRNIERKKTQAKPNSTDKKREGN